MNKKRQKAKGKNQKAKMKTLSRALVPDSSLLPFDFLL